MRVWTCQESGVKHDQINCYVRPPFLGTPLAPLREVEDWMQTTQWEMELHLVRPGNVQTTKDGDHKTISFLQRRKPWQNEGRKPYKHVGLLPSWKPYKRRTRPGSFEDALRSCSTPSTPRGAAGWTASRGRSGCPGASSSWRPFIWRVYRAGWDQAGSNTLNHLNVTLVITWPSLNYIDTHIKPHWKMC